MDESLIRDFFLEKASAATLASEADRAIEHVDSVNQVVRVHPLDRNFPITRQMLVSLCDAVLESSLPASALVPIGFILETSERLEWGDDDVMSTVLNCWSVPEINYPLTPENIKRFKSWLLDLEPLPVSRKESTHAARGPDRLLFKRERIEIQ